MEMFEILGRTNRVYWTEQQKSYTKICSIPRLQILQLSIEAENRVEALLGG